MIVYGTIVVSVNEDVQFAEPFQELNLKSTYLSSRMYLRALKGKSGVILNVSSSASSTMIECLSSYGPSKTAVNRLTDFIDAGSLKLTSNPLPRLITYFIQNIPIKAYAASHSILARF